MDADALTLNGLRESPMSDTMPGSSIHSQEHGDVLVPLGTVPSPDDPFALRRAKKTDEELHQLKKKGSIGRRVSSFYKECVVCLV